MAFCHMRGQRRMWLPRVLLGNDRPTVRKVSTSIAALRIGTLPSRWRSFTIAAVAAVGSTGRANFDFGRRTTISVASTFAHRYDDHFLLSIHKQFASLFLQFFVLQQSLSSISTGTGDVRAVADAVRRHGGLHQQLFMRQ